MVEIPSLDSLFEDVYADIEGVVKRFFFASNGFFDCFLFRADFGKDVAHRFRHDIDKFAEERLLKSQRTAITDRPTQNATQHVPATFVRWNGSIGNCKRERSDVIRDHTKRDIDLDLFWGAHAADVLVPAARGDFLDRRVADR